jgi:hypothetical protein
MEDFDDIEMLIKLKGGRVTQILDKADFCVMRELAQNLTLDVSDEEEEIDDGDLE